MNDLPARLADTAHECLSGTRVGALLLEAQSEIERLTADVARLRAVIADLCEAVLLDRQYRCGLSQPVLTTHPRYGEWDEHHRRTSFFTTWLVDETLTAARQAAGGEK